MPLDGERTTLRDCSQGKKNPEVHPAAILWRPVELWRDSRLCFLEAERDPAWVKIILQMASDADFLLKKKPMDSLE
jgi:hypothetical protein